MSFDRLSALIGLKLGACVIAELKGKYYVWIPKQYYKSNKNSTTALVGTVNIGYKGKPKSFNAILRNQTNITELRKLFNSSNPPSYLLESNKDLFNKIKKVIEQRQNSWWNRCKKTFTFHAR
jgi:hypothetical protein